MGINQKKKQRRPRKSNRPQEVIMVAMPKGDGDEVKDALLAAANADDRSLSNFCYRILRDWLENNR